MDIKFTGKYKSITAFEWLNIPKFAVITGPNGTGKSQLLKVIYNTIINDKQERERVEIKNETIFLHQQEIKLEEKMSLEGIYKIKRYC